MPLLTILTYILAVQALPWPEPLFGGSRIAVAITLGTHTAIVLLTWLDCLRLARRLRSPQSDRYGLLRRYSRVRFLLPILNLLSFMTSLAVFGWGHAVRSLAPTVTMGENAVMAPMAELLVILPAVATTILSWLGHYVVERAIFETSPVFKPFPFFKPLGFLFFQFRMYGLFVLTPTVLNVAQLSFARLWPTAGNDVVSASIGIVVLASGLVLFPLFLPYVLGLVPMHAGPGRDRLDRIAKRLNVGLRNWLVWPTRGTIPNAFVAGVIPQARYVIFSDELLAQLTPDEIDAVCGHELGHVRHRHLIYYALFLILSAMAIFAGLVLISKFLSARMTLPAETVKALTTTMTVVLAGLYLFVVYGFLSRGCEHQADIAGCLAVSCDRPDCRDHYDWELSATPVAPTQTPCPTGIRTFCHALDTVVGGESADDSRWRRFLAKLRAWQHGPVPERIQKLQTYINQPERIVKFQRRFFLFKLALLLVLALTAGVLAAISTISL